MLLVTKSTVRRVETAEQTWMEMAIIRTHRRRPINLLLSGPGATKLAIIIAALFLLAFAPSLTALSVCRFAKWNRFLLLDLLFVEDTWHLGHPVVPPAAEELSLRRKIRRLVKGTIKNINKITRIGPVLK